jgi:hypothetical protein
VDRGYDPIPRPLERFPLCVLSRLLILPLHLFLRGTLDLPPVPPSKSCSTGNVAAAIAKSFPTRSKPGINYPLLFLLATCLAYGCSSTRRGNRTEPRFSDLPSPPAEAQPRPETLPRGPATDFPVSTPRTEIRGPLAESDFPIVDTPDYSSDTFDARLVLADVKTLLKERVRPESNVPAVR